MKILSMLLCAVLFGTITHAQIISYDDFKEIIPFLQTENFKGAFEKTDKLLSTTKNDSSDVRGIVTYINIFSSAGMVTLDEMTHDDFQKNARKYVGQKLVMSAHPCIDSAVYGYNSLKFERKDGTYQGVTVSSNSKKTNILCFEYFNFSEEVNPADFIGKNVRTGGTLESVEVNPNKSKVWICRLHITNAFARAMIPR